jgi:hypothetical protein
LAIFSSIYANVGKLNPEIAGEDRAIVIVNHGQGIVAG